MQIPKSAIYLFLFAFKSCFLTTSNLSKCRSSLMTFSSFQERSCCIYSFRSTLQNTSAYCVLIIHKPLFAARNILISEQTVHFWHQYSHFRFFQSRVNKKGPCRFLCKAVFYVLYLLCAFSTSWPLPEYGDPPLAGAASLRRFPRGWR